MCVCYAGMYVCMYVSDTYMGAPEESWGVHIRAFYLEICSNKIRTSYGFGLRAHHGYVDMLSSHSLKRKIQYPA